MTKRSWGVALVGLGVLLMIAGLILMVSGGTEPATISALSTTSESTTSGPTTTSTSMPQPTTTSEPTTTAAPTTTTIPPQTVEDFVAEYRIALDEDDVDFLFDRLHPLVVEAYGEEVCRTWVETEVLALEDYQLEGEASGPADQLFTDPDGEQFAIADTFTAPVSFTFQGERFEADAQFALVDSLMFWLGTCNG